MLKPTEGNFHKTQNTDQHQNLALHFIKRKNKKATETHWIQNIHFFTRFKKYFFLCTKTIFSKHANFGILLTLKHIKSLAFSKKKDHYEIREKKTLRYYPRFTTTVHYILPPVKCRFCRVK